MKKLHRTLIAALWFGTAQLGFAQTPDSTVLATVEGKDITQMDVRIYAEQRKIDLSKLKPEQQHILVEALINRELLVKIAKQKGIDKNPENIAFLRNLQETGLAGLAIKEVSDTFTITDQEIQDYYQKNVVDKAPQQFKARHILVKTEDKAKQLIEDLNKGADFAELAKKHSTGPTGKKGGDLGWFQAKQMVKPFSDALAKMSKGSYTKTPVKTRFGWHVILLEDEKSNDVAKLDKVKDAIVKQLKQQKMAAELVKLREKANVVVHTKITTPQKK